MNEQEDGHLSERHARELREASAIADEVIAERGYRTITDPVELLELGFADYQARTPALLIPLHGVDGSNGRHAIKPERPRIRDGKPVKYDYPAGQSPILDVPPRCLESVRDATVPLFFTEGAKKADCLAGLGYCAVNIWGVFNWAYRDHSRMAFDQSGEPSGLQALPDWEPILPTLDGRVCYLCFDSDAFSKAQVGLALRRLENFLGRHGALVYVVHLPDAADGSKQGVDDLVASSGAEVLEQLVDHAEASASRAMVQRLQAELRAAREQQSAQAALLRNAKLTAAQKLVALVTINEAGWRKSTGAPAPYTVNADRLREAAGVKSVATVSSSLKVLCEDGSGLFSKSVTREYVEGMGWRSTMMLVPRADSIMGLLQAAATYVPERPARERPDRPRCPDHPFANVTRRSRLLCCECGQLLPHQPADVILNDKICSSGDDTTGNEEEQTLADPNPGTKGAVFLNSESVSGRDSLLASAGGCCRRCGRPWNAHGPRDPIACDGYGALELMEPG